MQVAYLLFDGFASLDAVGPYQVLSNLPAVESTFVARTPGPTPDEVRSMSIVADRLLEEVTAPDVVVVPGGSGSRALLEDEAVLSWLRAVHERSTWTTSVCTGALLLAAAGILDRAPATTFWLARDLLASLGAQPVERRVVQHGKILTAAGVSAGIDMALRLVQLLYGDKMAQAIQLGIEYDPAPPFDAGSPHKAPPEVVNTVRAAFDARESARRNNHSDARVRSSREAIG